MDPSIPQDHAFQPVNNQQITEEDVRSFLQSFPEFKDCRFEVEIVQANQNGHQQPLGNNLKDILAHNDSFLDPSTEHSTILPPELRDQYLRVESINLPFDNDEYMRQQQMYTRIEPEQEYIPPTEEDIKKAVWEFEKETSLQPTNSFQPNIQPPPPPNSSYYSIQEHQHSSTASSKSLSSAAEEEIQPVQVQPVQVQPVQVQPVQVQPAQTSTLLPTPRTPYSPTSNVSSSAASFVDQQNKMNSDFKQSFSPKRKPSPNASPIKFRNNTVAVTSENDRAPSTPAPSSDNEPPPVGNDPAQQDDQRTNVGELVRRFSQSTTISNNETAIIAATNINEEKEVNTTMEMQRAQPMIETPMPADKLSMNGYRRTPARRSRTADSDPTGQNYRKHERAMVYRDEPTERKSYSHRRHHHHHHNGHTDGMVYNENNNNNNTISRRSIRQKHMRAPSPPPPPQQQMSFSKNQKYCYINGEKFRMVDYTNMRNFPSPQQPYSLPVETNSGAYYPPRGLSTLSGGALYNRSCRPCDDERCIVSRRTTQFPSHRQKRHPQEVPVMWNTEGGRRRMSNRGFSMHNGTGPLYGTTNPYMTAAATPSTKQWNKLVSHPKASGAARFYNPPYSQFSMWT